MIQKQLPGRIIIDLTEFNDWTGHLTGVQRVVRGLSDGMDNNVNLHDREVVYVTFDSRKGNFNEASLDDLEDSPQVTKDKSTGVIQQYGYKEYAKKVYKWLPLAVQDRVTPSHKQFIKNVGKKLYNKFKRQNVGVPAVLLDRSDQEFTDFRATDTIISAGRAWDDAKYIVALSNLKHKYGLKLAFVVYDLIPIYQQHTFGPGLTDRFSLYLFDILSNANYLLPISKSTKKDLMKYAYELGFLNLPKIITFRLGDDLTPSQAVRPSSIEDDFALCVGTIEARKNHIDIYFAYKLAAQENIDLPVLYIVGRPGWLTSEVVFFITTDLEIKEKIKILYDVSDQELSWLYENALFTVYPSQYEGWGLPVAESLAYQTPVIASNTSSMTEIDADLVDYVSPYDTRALMDRMAYYSKIDNSQRQKKRIEESYRPNSWRDSVAEILSQI